MADTNSGSNTGIIVISAVSALLIIGLVVFLLWNNSQHKTALTAAQAAANQAQLNAAKAAAAAANANKGGYPINIGSGSGYGQGPGGLPNGGLNISNNNDYLLEQQRQNAEIQKWSLLAGFGGNLLKGLSNLWQENDDEPNYYNEDTGGGTWGQSPAIDLGDSNFTDNWQLV